MGRGQETFKFRTERYRLFGAHLAQAVGRARAEYQMMNATRMVARRLRR